MWSDVGMLLTYDPFRKKTAFCFHYYCAVYDGCKYSDTFWLADRVRLFVHYTISLSSLCKLIWRHWTYKMPVRYILSSVRVRLSIFSQLSIIQCMGLCVCSLPIPLVMIERIEILSYYHHIYLYIIMYWEPISVKYGSKCNICIQKTIKNTAYKKASILSRPKYVII